MHSGLSLEEFLSTYFEYVWSQSEHFHSALSFSSRQNRLGTSSIKQQAANQTGLQSLEWFYLKTVVGRSRVVELITGYLFFLSNSGSVAHQRPLGTWHRCITPHWPIHDLLKSNMCHQWCIIRLTCSHPELTKDHVLTSAYVIIFLTVARNAVNKSVWRKKDCSWP